ncbi:hypothetical protein KC644_01845 [Candidatus Berkelbacteria bacterium]|nr:hypothetical protein [Candidatus Berkelbacteria bacterium]
MENQRKTEANQLISRIGKELADQQNVLFKDQYRFLTERFCTALELVDNCHEYCEGRHSRVKEILFDIERALAPEAP